MLIYDVRNLYMSIRIKYGKRARLDCHVLENAFDEMIKLACMCRNESNSSEFKHILYSHGFKVLEKVFMSKPAKFLDTYCTSMVASEIVNSDYPELHVISQSPHLIPAIRVAQSNGVRINLYGMCLPHELIKEVDHHQELEREYIKFETAKATK